jgi:hypothetical protein
LPTSSFFRFSKTIWQSGQAKRVRERSIVTVIEHAEVATYHLLFQVGDHFDEVPGPLTECTFIDASTETAEDWFRVVGLQQKKAPEKMAWFGNLVIRCIWIGVTDIKATPYVGTNFRLSVEV